MGRGTAGRLLSFNNREEVVEGTVDEVARAVDNLAKK